MSPGDQQPEARRDDADALAALAAAIGENLSHPLVPDFLRLALESRSGVRLAELVRRCDRSWPELERDCAQAIADALGALEQVELAFELSSCSVLSTHPEAARKRADWAMRLGRYEAAIAAADLAIAGLLHRGLDVESFIRLSLRGAQAEGLMRVERVAVARLRRLHEPIAIRWEALRRSGRVAEARQMRALCIRHFPERASVWAAAGNQALDEGEVTRADAYFERCLALSPNWTAGLAGKAIVCERRKDWQRALEYRERVVRVEGALEREDAPSLQRVMRYAAALGRAGRWIEAGALFRRCVALRAFESLSAERPVLVRVFSRELYSPATLATLAAQRPSEFAGSAPEVLLGLREAAVFGLCHERIRARADLAPGARLQLLGMCAWLADDEARGYALLDEAEVHCEGELATQFYLACCADALGAPELPSITRFALDAARTASRDAASGTAADAGEVFYARITLARFAPSEAQASGLNAAQVASEAFAALHADALVREAGACPRLIAPAQPLDLHAQLRRLAAFRAAHRIGGHSALDVARSSAEALAAIAVTAAITDPSS